VSRVIEDVNLHLSRDTLTSEFATLFYCVVSQDGRRLTYCNAGHNPPLLVRADGRVDWLKGGGLILGVRPRARYQQRSCRLERGDIVVLYSDGVTEALRPATREEFGEARLSGLVAAHRKERAQQILERVREAVEEWAAGAPPVDDVTLVVARRIV